MAGFDFEAEYSRCRAMVESRLERYVEGPGLLREAMRYSLLAGGKRLRPVIVLQFCRAAGGDMEKALPAACAVEMLHTYTLIHDDLPCMDDDDLRRGRPANHVVFGEGIATLAGDALQAAAFGAILDSDLPPESVVRMGRILARAAGPDGVCLGQALDLKSTGREVAAEELAFMQERKTADLLVASAQIGVVAAGGGEDMISAAGSYALALGAAFQIRDDVLDCTGSTASLGKPAGSDAAKSKATFATICGVEECERIIREKTLLAVSALSGFSGDTAFLEALAINLEQRKC